MAEECEYNYDEHKRNYPYDEILHVAQATFINGSISFGSVISFIFTDLIIIPIVRIHAKYYGRKMSRFLFMTFNAAIVLAGYTVEALFAFLHLTPHVRNIHILESSISWNYTTFLNIFFILVAGLLITRFLRTGGPAMLRMMGNEQAHHH